MARFTACGNGVVGLVGIVLIIKVNQEQPHFRRQRAIVVSGSELPGSRFFRFHIAALHSLANLAVLYGTERSFCIGIKIPAVGEVIKYVKRRQRGVIADLLTGAFQAVVLVRLNMFETHPRRDRPVADIDAIVDIPGVSLGARAGIAVVRTGGVGQLAADGGGVIAHLVRGFIHVAIADADFMRGSAKHKALAVARLDTAHPVFTRGKRGAFPLLQITAAQRMGIEALNVELVPVIGLELIAEAGQLTSSPEAIF